MPGAFGTANLAKVTGLNEVVRFVDEAREFSLESVRLASDSEPPCEAVSSPPSETDAIPFISRALDGTGPGPCRERS